MKPKIIGLSGPIASGKNEVAKILRRHGAYLIDADEVGHKLLNPQSDVWRELIKAFGSKILHPGGKINRKKLGEIVFSNPKLLKKLNSVMHPAMKEEIVKVVRGQGSGVSKGKNLVVINAAVLKEIGLIPLVDEVWVVLADKGKRINRLIKNGLTREQAAARVSSQVPEKIYLRIADRVIRNNGTKAELKRKVVDLLASEIFLSPQFSRALQ